MTANLKVVSASDATEPSSDESIAREIEDLERTLREAPPYEEEYARRKTREEKSARRKARDEAMDRAGRWLFGTGVWIGELGKQEWELAKKPGDLPADPHEAQRMARARFRSRASDEQFGAVFHWLQVAHDINCSLRGFDAAKFEKFWSSLPVVLTGTDARRAAIRQLVNAGQWPGEGGTCTWKVFLDDIEGVCGRKYTRRTIERDMRELGLSRRD